MSTSFPMRKGVGTPGVKKASEVESLASHAANPAAHPDYLPKRDLSNLMTLTQHLIDRLAHADNYCRRQELVFTKSDYEATKNYQLSSDPTNYKSNNPKRHVITSFVLNQILLSLGITDSSSLVKPSSIIKSSDPVPTDAVEAEGKIPSYAWLKPYLTRLGDLIDRYNTFSSSVTTYINETIPNTYLSKTDAAGTYLSQEAAGNTYRTKEDSKAKVIEIGTVETFVDDSAAANATATFNVDTLAGKMNQYRYDLVVKDASGNQIVNPTLKVFTGSQTVSITVTVDGSDYSDTDSFDTFAYFPLNTCLKYGTGATDKTFTVPKGRALLGPGDSTSLTGTFKVYLVASPLNIEI